MQTTGRSLGAAVGMNSAIEDYGIIGNSHTAALVGRDGSIDWLCLPRFDAEAVFAALLGDARNGRWLIGPVERSAKSTCSYRRETGILETRMETDSGRSPVPLLGTPDLTTTGEFNEARAWREWLLRSAAGHPAELQIMYGIAGERRLTELELDWLPGYGGSASVRIGNVAYQQLQIDVFGELMDTLFACNRFGLEASNDAWNLQTALLNFLEEVWDKPDHGLWESRGEPRHFTFSKMMAWVAFDRAVKSIDRYGCKGPRERWDRLRTRISDEIMTRGYDRARNSFVQYYGSHDLDASLLLIPQLGFLPAADPRVVGTVEAIERELVVDGLVMRYPTHSGTDGLPAGEGAFIVCSFWRANSLALIGRRDDAVALFERLLGSVSNTISRQVG